MGEGKNVFFKYYDGWQENAFIIVDGRRFLIEDPKTLQMLGWEWVKGRFPGKDELP